MATRFLAVGTLVCLFGIFSDGINALVQGEEYYPMAVAEDCQDSEGLVDCSQHRRHRCACGAACAAGCLHCEGCCKRLISYQDKNDLFYNFYEGPLPSGTAAQMYVSPLPVPAHVGHTYVTYQPLMPHEFMYKHCRSHYAHVPGAGWSRAKVRYHTYGLRLQDIFHIWSNDY